MTASPDQHLILEVKHLTVRFPVTGGVFLRRVGEVRAVDDVSFAIGRGETLGLVGESGCGKTTVGRAIVNILAALAYGVQISGEILYRHESGVVDLARLGRRAMRAYRSDIQMVFQDPYASLNPRKTVAQIVGEPLRIHVARRPAGGSTQSEIADRVAWLLEKVGLSPEQANRYPHEFSGGQRQRIGIARALATSPRLVIADEPVSALDVSVQAQVINLMQDLQQEFGLSYLFIAHDLSVVRHISSRIAVMYLGHIVETGDAETIYQSPLHPYSRALLAAAPRPDPTAPRAARSRLAGDIPSPINKPSGCAFRTRCPIARDACADAVPPLEMRDGRLVACPYSDPQNREPEEATANQP
jgi:oligopeptide transport system ATP-binding protein